jgi:DNA-binding NtrC family response regulator
MIQSTLSPVNGSDRLAVEAPILPVPAFPWTESIEIVLAKYERQLLQHALKQSEGVKRTAATLLRISRYALERRLHRVSSLLDDASPRATIPSGHPDR